MNKKQRLNFLKTLNNKNNIIINAQETIDAIKETEVNGDEIADSIFQKLLDNISLEELEKLY